MGKGNRNKQNAARGVLAGSGAKTAGRKSGYKTWIGTLIVTVVLLALIAVVVLSAMKANGTFTRRQVMVKSENYEITVPMMSYMVYTQYQNFIDQYQNTGYMAYIRGTGGTGLSTNVALRDQNYSVTTDEITGETVTVTWFDYFAKSALSASKQLLSLCEGARHYGITLTEEEQAQIEQTLDLYKYYAQLYGTNTNGYLRNLYGAGVHLSDVRQMMELTMLANKYTTLGQEQAEYAATDTAIDVEYEENRGQYVKYLDYIGVSYTATFEEADEGADDPAHENMENNATYVSEQHKYSARVEALAACADEAAFRTLLKSYFKEDILDEEPMDDAEADAKAEEKLAACVHLNASQDSTSGPSGLAPWLFGSTSRERNETTTFVEENDAYYDVGNEYIDAESTYYAVMVIEPLHVSTEMVRSVGHILFKTDTYQDKTAEQLTGKAKELAERVEAKGLAVSAETMSAELLALLFEEGKITDHQGYYTIDESVFEEYGNIYNEDSNIFYDDVNPGQMVESFNDWMFAEGRVEGEITYPAAVSTQYGYHIMYYRGNEQPAWRAEVRQSMIDEAYNTWEQEANSAYTTTESEKIEKLWSKVGA